MSRLRVYHALLAVLAVASYVSGELGTIHALLGYGLGAVLLFRLGWAASGHRSLGLSRFYPQFKGLRPDNALTHPAVSRALMLAIALALVGVTATGIVIDRGRTLGASAAATISTAFADDDEHRHGRRTADAADDRVEAEGEGMLTELHEALAELLPLLVALHAGYLLALKRPLARFMLFADGPGAGTRRERAPARGGGAQPTGRSASSPPM